MAEIVGGECKGPHKVLVVEDVSAMRALIRASLQDDSTCIVEAGDLETARALLCGDDGSDFDVLLLDLELPDGFGLDLMPDVPDATRVIALSAHEDRETELQCRSAGCGAVLNKSRDLRGLKDAVLGAAASVAPRRGGLNGSVAAQYATFLAESRVELECAQARKDYAAVRQLAHRLRGTAIHFGYPSVGFAANGISSALLGGGEQQRERAIGALIDRIGDALEARHRSAPRPIYRST
jgi:DNA-binding response OmpR family regulator